MTLLKRFHAKEGFRGNDSNFHHAHALTASVHTPKSNGFLWTRMLRKNRVNMELWSARSRTLATHWKQMVKAELLRGLLWVRCVILPLGFVVFFGGSDLLCHPSSCFGDPKSKTKNNLAAAKQHRLMRRLLGLLTPLHHTTSCIHQSYIYARLHAQYMQWLGIPQNPDSFPGLGPYDVSPAPPFAQIVFTPDPCTIRRAGNNPRSLYNIPLLGWPAVCCLVRSFRVPARLPEPTPKICILSKGKSE